MAARIRRPSSRPGPRNDRPDVRFALSYDALKMNGIRRRAVISARRPASMAAWPSLSMTHGPAMSTSGRPPPMRMSPMVMGITERYYIGRKRAGWGDRPSRSSRHGFSRAMNAAGALVLRSGSDERGKERMRPGRLRLEFRMELNGDVPRMAGQFGDLHELAVRRPTRDTQAVLGQGALIQTIELVAMPVPLVN